jgi:thiol-disulfide isomerase/thioredoxin
MTNLTRKHKKFIGKIYANWCGHCTKLKPEWEKMKQHLKNHPIEIVEIEASEIARLEAFKKKHGIMEQGYPTIFKISGKVEYYKGPRDVKSMTQWALSDTIKGGKRRIKRRTIKRRKNTYTF